MSLVWWARNAQSPVGPVAPSDSFSVPTMPVRDNTDLHRFELDAGGETAVAYYRLSPGRVIFTHTEVAPALRGRGIASALIHGALETARARGLKVEARCGFVS